MVTIQGKFLDSLSLTFETSSIPTGATYLEKPVSVAPLLLGLSSICKERLNPIGSLRPL